MKSAEISLVALLACLLAAPLSAQDLAEQPGDPGSPQPNQPHLHQVQWRNNVGEQGGGDGATSSAFFNTGGNPPAPNGEVGRKGGEAFYRTTLGPRGRNFRDGGRGPDGRPFIRPEDGGGGGSPGGSTYNPNAGGSGAPGGSPGGSTYDPNAGGSSAPGGSPGGSTYDPNAGGSSAPGGSPGGSTYDPNAGGNGPSYETGGTGGGGGGVNGGHPGDPGAGSPGGAPCGPKGTPCGWGAGGVPPGAGPSGTAGCGAPCGLPCPGGRHPGDGGGEAGPPSGGYWSWGGGAGNAGFNGGGAGPGNGGSNGPGPGGGPAGPGGGPNPPGGPDRGTRGGGCFVAGTPVATPLGERAIETLKVGDPVYAVDPATYELVPSRVARVFHHLKLRSERVRVTLSDGRAVVATTVHRFYDPARRTFRAIGGFSAGDRVVLVSRVDERQALEAAPPSVLPAALRGRALEPLGAAEPRVATQARELTITSIERLGDAPTDVFNLTVDDPLHDYLADDVLVHNLKAIQR